MALEWLTTRKPKANLAPYAHWWAEKEQPFIPDGLLDKIQPELRLGRLSHTKGRVGRRTAGAFYAKGADVPLPIGAANPDQHNDWDLEKTKAKLPTVPEDTVLVGIVDTGIALSHSRFRMSNGKTRFISSWQQSAPFARQTELPCGQEVYADDINCNLDTYGPTGALGYVDEIAFNRELCLTEPIKPGGQRDLEMAAAHGTHVLDLAAGLEPDGNLSDFTKRLRLISVNLPAQYAHGTAGAFLAYFAIYAVERIIHMADALWARNNPLKEGGYPLVINFSYGMTAGPKDGSHIFERAIKEILSRREENGEARKKAKSPVRLILPAGNDNLERCAASCVLGETGAIHDVTGHAAKSSTTIPLRILPSDSTANFVEIWFEDRSEDELEALVQGLQVSVTPPGSKDLMLEPLQVGKHQDLGNVARVYVDVSKSRRGQFKLALLVCVAPTTLDIAKAPIAPAGFWTIDLKFEGAPVDVSFFVQSDQSAVRGSKTGRRSYFDHNNYKAILENGALADTHTYEPNFGSTTDNDNWRYYGPVQRRGTHNALATIVDRDVVAVGGFDDSNGYPAIYSSTADGNRTKPAGREAISISYPSENGVSTFGLLASGARDGSVTAYRGTSMATALATRDAVFSFLRAKGPGNRIGTESWFRKRAEAFENKAKLGQVTDHWGQYLGWPRVRILKSGVGRIAAPDNDRHWRRLGATK